MSKESKINKYAGEKLKELRNRKNLTQQELAEDLRINQQQVARYENGLRNFKQDFLFDLADYFNVSINYFFPPITFDNAEIIDLPQDLIQIPVYGSIKAGTPIDAQTDIIEYINIPRDMVKGNKQFYGLKISGDSMYPDYKESDIVIFENTNDLELANGKDCAVMINSTECTFKKVKLSQAGIQLIPLNLNNSDGYEPTFYDSEQINNSPIKIIGVARQIHRNV